MALSRRPMLREVLFVVGTLLGVGVPLFLIWSKEQVLASGHTVLLELAPVDPRSLMQGDYMILRYKLARSLESGAIEGERPWPIDGHLVLTVDDRGVASSARRHTGDPLQPDERLLRYRVRDYDVRLGAEAFFFQEGHGDYYANARYGELKVDDHGHGVLVGLRDEALKPMDGPPPVPSGPIEAQ